MLRFLRGGGKRTKAIWWGLTIVIVVTFLGGFVFLFGSGLGGGNTARVTGAVATIDGQSISRAEYQNSLNDQRQAFSVRFGAEPGEHDLQALENQAFRTLVLQKLLDRKAKALGLKAHDHEVLLQLQTAPPQQLLTAQAFQTNGQFDPQKYTAAMKDPNNNWAPFEEMVRAGLPVRKLQERLFTSIKLSDGELRREWQVRNERLTATLVSIAPDRSAPAPTVSDADIQKVYEKYKSRFVSGPQRQLEVLLVPKAFGDAPIKAASDLATSLVKRIRAGENFTSLSRQYSDAPGSENGGLLDRVVSPSDFGGLLGPQLALMDTGQVTDPVRDGGRFIFFKLAEKVPQGPNGQPGLKVAQFIIRVKPDEDAIRRQFADLNKLRAKAQREGLGRAAAALALTTTKTAFFDLSNPPNEITAAPSAADWAFGAKTNEVSPVIEALDVFAIVQLAASKEEGPMPREAISDQLRKLAQLEKLIDALKPKADALEAALKQGKTLEQAAAAAGVTAQKIEGITRAGQDPRLFGLPEVVGRLFAAKPGQVIGPLRGLGGYAAARLESRTEPDWTQFEATRAQFAQQLLENRQRVFMERFTTALRTQAHVKDLRSEGDTYQ
jgi:peptidyl-prolyl cis-trans isomerase D